jgi:hypothetical protein
MQWKIDYHATLQDADENRPALTETFSGTAAEAIKHAQHRKYIHHVKSYCVTRIMGD